MIKAVFWDFGGVITTSPFDSFNIYEESQNLPKDLIRTINSTNPDNNAWAKLERSEIDLEEFDSLFEVCLLYTSPSPRDGLLSRMPSSA